MDIDNINNDTFNWTTDDGETDDEEILCKWTTDDKKTDDEEILCKLTKNINLSDNKLNYYNQVCNIKFFSDFYFKNFSTHELNILIIRKFLNDSIVFVKNDYQKYPWDYLIGSTPDSDIYISVKNNMEKLLNIDPINNEFYILKLLIDIYEHID